MNTTYINTAVMISLFKGEKRNEKTLFSNRSNYNNNITCGMRFWRFGRQHQSDKKSENSNTQTEQASNNKNSNSNNGHSSNNNEPRGRVEDLTQSQKVALAINDASVSQYVVNASELRNHSFYANYNGGGQRKVFILISWKHYQKVEGAPTI